MAKMTRVGVTALVAVLVFGMAAAVSGQEKPRPPQVPLKLQLVLSRTHGDKKISSIPYQLWLTTNEPPTRLRMGIQVPLPSGNKADVGTNIDCSATNGIEAGIYKLSLTVTDTSLNAEDKERGTTVRNFTSTFTILLRDGQTAQYTSATDPVSGEVLKIDATLNVLK